MSAYDDIPDAITPQSPYNTLPAGVAPITSMGYGAIQGATLGNAAKASAAGRAYVVNPVLDWLESKGIGVGGSGQTYEQMRDEYNQTNNEMQKANPWSYGAGAIAGSAPAIIATRGNVAGVAGIGAVQGAGETAGSPEDVATNAAKGAGINAALGIVGSAIPTMAQLAKNNLVKRYAAEMGISIEEAAQDFLTNVGKSGTGYVASGAIKNVLSSGGRLALPAAGAIGGGYVGGQLAPVFGIDKSTGQIIGAELGGGASAYGVWKRGMLSNIGKGSSDTLGYAQSAYPSVVKVIGTSPTNTIAASNSINNQTPPNPYEALPNNSRLMNVIDELKQGKSGYQD